MNHLTYTFAAALVAFSLILPDLSILQDGAVSQPASKPAAESQPANPFAWPVETAAKRIPTRRTQGNVVITNATVIPVSSPASERASILVRGGKIAAIGTNITIPEGSAVIDARGMYVVPGAMDCHSHLAIEGDVNEGSDSITAECKIGDVINPDDLSIYRALAGGCTSARLLHGSANAIGGEHAIIKLKWNRTAQDLLLTDAKRGIKFALGENPKRSNGRDPNRPLRYPATRMGVEAVIRRSFDEAKDLIQQKKDDLEKISRGEFVPPRRRDSRLETLASILSGDVDIHSHCYRSDEILMLLETADHYGIKVKTLQHVLEGFKVAPEIALHGAGASTFSDWWAYKMEAYDATPYNAALMVRAGVNVTINSDSAELIRRLHLDSGKSIRYGMLTVDECLSLVTLNTAMQLGIEKRMGSIEVGKDADLAIFDAHPLSVEAKCIYTLVDGEIEFERTDAFANLAAELLKLRKEGPASKPAYAATTPWAKTPAIPSPPLEKIAIIRATVVPVSGPAIADGTVIIEDGRITAVGPALPAPTNYKVIDARGLFVYPGLIDTTTFLGLTEVASVPATVDQSERDLLQPDLRASRAIHAQSEHINVARANGITTVLVAPGGGMLAGQSALVHLDGWTPAHMLVADPLTLNIEFPPQRADDPEKPAEDNQKEREKFYKSSTRELKIWFERANAYAKRASKQIVDPKLSAIAPYAAGQRPIIMNINNPRDAVGAVRFAEENQLKIIIRSPAASIGKIAKFLAEKNVPVLIGPVTSLPASPDDPYDTVYNTPRLLHSAGVNFAFASGDSANVRNLPFQAGMSVAYGLPLDAAIRSVTLSAAEILGVSEKLGSLEVGKIADVIITDGNPLEVRTHVKHMIIGGREVELTSKHTELYEKYLNRLTPEQRAKAGAAK